MIPASLNDVRLGDRRIAVDVETYDPDLRARGPGIRRDGYVAGIAIGVDDGPRWYLPVRHAGGGNLDEKKVWAFLRRELNRFPGEVVGAHLLYDLDYLAEHGVTFAAARRFIDVLIAEPLFDENRFSGYSLEATAHRHLGEGKDEARLREAAAARGIDPKSELWRLPAAEVVEYAVGDVDRPLRLAPIQEKLLAAEGLTDNYETELGLIPLLLAMRRRGVRVDLARARKADAALAAHRARLVAKLSRAAGRQVELWIPETFAPLLDAEGVTIPRTLKTDKPSITKPFLERLARRGLAVAQDILDARKYDKAKGTFIEGHVLGHVIGDRVHCEFKQGKGDDDGAKSGRFSCANPNLQQLPSRDPEITPLVRSIFRAERGERWWRGDYSQIEFRFLVHYARGGGADEARRRYREEPATSFHRLAAELAKMNADDPATYKNVKNVNFCKVYGGGVPKIAETAGISVEEAARFVAEYDRELPFVRKTFADATAAAARRGFVTDISGRRHRFNLWEPRAWTDGPKPRPLPREEAAVEYGPNLRRAYAWHALNRLLQGGSAGMIKKAMVNIWRSGVCDIIGPPLVTVHDELGFSQPRGPAAREAMAEVKRLMESAYTLRVPVLVDVETGPSWGEVK